MGINVAATPTLLHQDTHLANWYALPDGSMGIADWQCVARGQWALDVAYALAIGLSTEDRRAWKRDLIALYLQRLAEKVPETPTFELSSAVMQCLCLGIAILIDKRDRPIFPCWSGYLSLWTATLLAPAGVVPLFKDGPFAWNGNFGFWVPLSIFCIWVSTTTWFLVAVIKHDADNLADRPSESLA
jgi:phosphotransferase family enzyme